MEGDWDEADEKHFAYVSRKRTAIKDVGIDMSKGCCYHFILDNVLEGKLNSPIGCKGKKDRKEKG